MKGDDFKRLAVISIDDGARLGHVDDLRLDTKALKVAAICFEAEGQHSLVAFEDVRSIGNDAVTVQNRDVARSFSAETALANLPGLEQMQQLKVVDERGDYLGKVSDVEIDTATGRIVEIRTQEGGVLGIGGKRATFTADQVRSVGDDLIVVAARSSEGQEEQKKKSAEES